MKRNDAKEANRRALLDAATVLIARQGGRVRLEDIAGAADLTTGAVYSIFGSKSDLLVAVLAREISRLDLTIEQYDPALCLREVIGRYVQAWIETYSGYSKTQVAFELQLVLSATQDEGLRRRLTQLLGTEIEELARLLENRIIDPARPSGRTSAEDAAAIARAIKAVLTGFGVREPFTAGASSLPELARQSCLALIALARPSPGA